MCSNHSGQRDFLSNGKVDELLRISNVGDILLFYGKGGLSPVSVLSLSILENPVPNSDNNESVTVIA